MQNLVVSESYQNYRMGLREISWPLVERGGGSVYGMTGTCGCCLYINLPPLKWKVQIRRNLQYTSIWYPLEDCLVINEYASGLSFVHCLKNWTSNKMSFLITTRTFAFFLVYLDTHFLLRCIKIRWCNYAFHLSKKPPAISFFEYVVLDSQQKTSTLIF